MRRLGSAFVFAMLAAALPGCKSSSSHSAACADGATRGCPYGGPPGTEGVGTCKAGLSICNAGSWSACSGEVTPAADVCRNNLDENCDGTPDDVFDPSAVEFAGNGKDDDCNGTIDDAPATCDGALAINSADPHDFARALDVCATASSASTVGFGFVGGAITLADGTGAPNSGQHALRPHFGTGVLPRAGTSLAILSTGVAAGSADAGFAGVDMGTSHGTSSAPPAAWLASNGGVIPIAAGCPASNSASAFDPAMLTLRLRVPDDAHAFAVDADFLTADYPEWVCSPYDDVFVALLDSGFSGTPSNPADGNLAHGNSRSVVSASCAADGSGCPFSECVDGHTGCSNAIPSATPSYAACAESLTLAGTGFDVPAGGKCDSNSLSGGGTGWVTVAGNVVPGEVITLRFAIWDSSDDTLDSDVVLDDLRWLPANVTPGIQ